MFEAVETLVTEHAELEQRMADPAVHSDPAVAKKVGQRYAELTAVVKTYREWQQSLEDVEAARELEMADEVATLETAHPRAGGTVAAPVGAARPGRRQGHLDGDQGR